MGERLSLCFLDGIHWDWGGFVTSMSKSVFKNWEGSDCWLLVWEAHASKFIGQAMESYLRGLISHKHASLIVFHLMPSSVIALRVITQLSPGCKTIQISQRKHPGISMVSLGCHNFMSVGYKQIIYVLIWFFSCLARSVTSLGMLKSHISYNSQLLFLSYVMLKTTGLSKLQSTNRTHTAV